MQSRGILSTETWYGAITAPGVHAMSNTKTTTPVVLTRQRLQALRGVFGQPLPTHLKSVLDEATARIAKKLDKAGRNKWFGGSGEGDHTQSVHLVKWMNTGKKRNGTTYCR